jgi:hypothetical protein
VSSIAANLKHRLTEAISMSWLKTGNAKNKRMAKNFIHENAQRRLDQELGTFRNQISNAMNVDAVHAVVIKQLRVGIPCTCSNHLITKESEYINHEYQTSTENVTARPSDDNRFSITMNTGGSAFGERGYDADSPETRTVKGQLSKERELSDFQGANVSRVSVEDGDNKIDRPEFDANEFEGGTKNCGICYTASIQPAFEFTNHVYTLMSHYNVMKAYGYNVSVEDKPNTFNSVTDDAYLEYEVMVPKYFTRVLFSIRNDTRIVCRRPNQLTQINGEPADKAFFTANRGSTVSIRIKNVDQFTHAYILFQSNESTKNANLTEEQDMINYENEVTIGDLNVVLEHSVGVIRSGDFIAIPARNLLLKVSAATRKSTATKDQWEWSVTGRATQRSEATFNIFKHHEIR